MLDNDIKQVAKPILCDSGGGPIHTCVPIHAHSYINEDNYCCAMYYQCV